MRVREVVLALGGAKKVAEMLGIPAQRVRMWSLRDRVGGAQVPAFWAACADSGIPWSPPGGEGRVPVTRRAA